jgi:hypothetical protein
MRKPPGRQMDDDESAQAAMSCVCVRSGLDAVLIDNLTLQLLQIIPTKSLRKPPCHVCVCGLVSMQY